MRKKLAMIAASVMLVTAGMGMNALAVSSPNGAATSAGAASTSPKTGDMNMLYVELAGAAFAVTAVAAKRRSKKSV